MSAEPPVPPGCRRFKLTLEYDGTPFCGWQGAIHGPTVESVLQEALAPFHDGDSGLRVAGRTDSGVHASAQVAHVDVRVTLTERKLLAALNGRIRPWPLSVLAVEAVPDGFHARFSAIRRRYVYRILNRRPPPALERNRVWHVPVALDAGAMNEGARQLLGGRHDFSSFRASQCQANSPLRTLEALTVERRGDEVWIAASARSFLHHQVRNMAGTLVEVGRGARPPEWVGAVLAARDRGAAGPTAPPEGLCLVGVDYPEG